MDMTSNVMNIVMGAIAVGVGIGALFGLAIYILNAVAFYAIAKNRGYNRPWLAWIPVACDYLKGAVADDINYRNGKSTKLRVWLLLASIVAKVGVSAYGVFQMVYSISMMRNIFGSIGNMNGYAQFLNQSAELSLILSLVSLVISALTIGYAVVYYIAMYRVYIDYVPNNAVLFLVLSILFNIVEPFLVLSIRNKPAISIYGAQNPQWRPVPPAQPYYAPPVAGQDYAAPPQQDAQPPRQDETEQ